MSETPFDLERVFIELSDVTARDAGTWEWRAYTYFVAADACYTRWNEAKDEFRQDQELGRTSSSKLLHEMDLLNVAVFLGALGAEILLKAAIVAADPRAIDRKEMYTHDLRALAEMAEIPIDSNEEKLLDRLGEAIMWSGRYPIPRWSNKHDQRKVVPEVARTPEGRFELKGPMPTSAVPDDWYGVCGLCRRLAPVIRARIADTRDPADDEPGEE